MRGALSAMGLMQSAHVTATLLLETLLAALHALVLCLAALAFRFPLVTLNAFALPLLLFFLTGTALAGLAAVFAVLLRRASSAVPAAFSTYVVAWIFQLVIFFGFPYKVRRWCLMMLTGCAYVSSVRGSVRCSVCRARNIGCIRTSRMLP